MTGAGVAHAAMIMRRSQPICGFCLLHEGNFLIAVAAHHGLDAITIALFIGALMRDVQLPRLELHVDLVVAGKVEHIVLGVFREIEQCLGALKTDLFFKLVRPGALARAELSAIAPRRAIAEAMGLDQGDGNAGARQIIGRLKAGEAAADNGDIDRARAIHRRIVRTLRNSLLIP